MATGSSLHSSDVLHFRLFVAAFAFVSEPLSVCVFGIVFGLLSISACVLRFFFEAAVSSVSVSVLVCIAESVAAYVGFFASVNVLHSLCLCLSVFRSVYVSVSVSLSTCLCLCVSLPLSLNSFITVSWSSSLRLLCLSTSRSAGIYLFGNLQNYFLLFLFEYPLLPSLPLLILCIPPSPHPLIHPSHPHSSPRVSILSFHLVIFSKISISSKYSLFSPSLRNRIPSSGSLYSISLSFPFLHLPPLTF